MSGSRTHPGASHITPTEWVGGRVLSPMWINESEPFRPELILWLERPADLIVKAEVLDPSRPVSFSQTLLDAMRAPMVGPPRQPRRVRVADPALADELRDTLGERLPVVVAPTPELDHVVRTMAEEMSEDAPQSYLEDGRVSETSVAALFRAAQVLYQMQPWKIAADSQILRVDVPQLDIQGAYLSIIGELGQSLGFILFSSLAVYQRFVRLADMGVSEDAAVDFGGDCLSLTFERAADLPPAMRREVAMHRWPVARATAYPIVEHRDRDGMPCPLNERQFRLATACAGALTAFLAHHREVFTAQGFTPVSETYEDATGLAVCLTATYEAFDQLTPTESEPVVPSPPQRVGRNEPCPCGSGKKYKKCHLGRDDGGGSSPSRIEAAHELGPRLVHAIFEHTRRDWSRLWIDLVERNDLAAAPPGVLLPWLVHDAVADGGTPADRYRAAQGPRLSAREGAWLDAEANAWLSIWEVTAVDAGVGVTVEDLLTGETRQVTEREGSKCLTVRDTLLARIVDFEGGSFFNGLYPQALSPFDAAEIVRGVRTRLRLRRAVPIPRLREPKIGVYMIGYWLEAVEDLADKRAVPPMLTNTDGDELLLTIDHFELGPLLRTEIEARLAALEGAERSPAENGRTVIHFERAGKRAVEDSITIGMARIDAGGLELETNSVRRADDLRQRVESACGGLVQHSRRDHIDPREAMMSGTAPEPRSPPLEGPEVDTVVLQIKERHYASWVDEPIPALNGQTPREAVETRAGRERLIVLLKELERTESREPVGRRFDVSILRRTLGVA